MTITIYNIYEVRPGNLNVCFTFVQKMLRDSELNEVQIINQSKRALVRNKQIFLLPYFLTTLQKKSYVFSKK